MNKMLILPGVAHFGGKYNPRGFLDRDSALEYARLRGYEGVVLDISGETGEDSNQTNAAVGYWVAHPDCTAIYGFSGGGYNAVYVVNRLEKTRARLELVVILGAPGAEALEGDFQVVRRGDPPDSQGGHMAGPRVLLEERQRESRESGG